MPTYVAWQYWQWLAVQPKQGNSQDLLEVCHQILLLQAAIGVASLFAAVWSLTIELEVLLNILVPVYTFYSAREVAPESQRDLFAASAYWSLGMALATLGAFFRFDVWRLLRLLPSIVIAGIQWLALGRLWCALQDKRLKQSRFFLNVVVLGKKAVAKPFSCSSRLGKLTGAFGGRLNSDAKLCQRLAERLLAGIPEKLSEAGVTAKVTVGFQRLSVMVLLVILESVDARRALVEVSAGKYADWQQRCRDIMPRRLRDEIDNLFMAAAASEMVRGIPECIAAQLSEIARQDVAVEAKPPEDQADYLLRLLSQLDRQEAEEET